MGVLTTLEAANRYNLSTSYLRVLLAKKRIKGRQARISKTSHVWLLEEPSLKRFLKKKRPVGRPKKS